MTSMIEYIIDVYEPKVEKVDHGITLFSFLNRSTNIFASRPSMIWGNTSGWRVRTNKGQATSILPEALDRLIYDSEHTENWDSFYGY